MNLQLISNSNNQEGGTNYTNDFTVTLKRPINNENGTAYISVLSVSYPLTTKNVLDNECKIKFSARYRHFRYFYPNHTQVINGFFDLGFENVFPSGIYTIDMIVNYLNNLLQQFSVKFIKEENGKISVTANRDFTYLFKQRKRAPDVGAPYGASLAYDHRTPLGEWGHHDKNSQYSYYSPIYAIELSEKLAYMLGFDNTVIKFDFHYSYVPVRNQLTVTGEHLYNITDGINNIYIYCDQIENSLVGDVEASLLAIVPLEITNQGSGESYNFTTTVTPKRLLCGIIEKFHITLYNSTGKLIPFDSGNVIITCRITRDD